ncbi:fluoride export protein 1 isoform X2 [Hibiscus syriacus]|uniref:fluoride export protein 1 isoform X2 n=1 Tax=Hibiscus syriacus TaxID=106335 RepID=UPI001923A184|nr:fluoride export protein 1 isoform X2 [Hibiscus syriacus]
MSSTSLYINHFNYWRVMDHVTNNPEPKRTGAFSRTSSFGSSLRKRSISMSSVVSLHIDDEIQSESVSEAGDIGDRALHSQRNSSCRLSLDLGMEGGPPIHPADLHKVSVASPVREDVIFPLPIDSLKGPGDNKQEKQGLPILMEYVSCLIHLAVFGILGVLTRYLLEKLFGPSVSGVTSNQSIIYPNLPSNMVGSFLMGWWGVVFKGDISQLSDILAIGLTTGFLGSVTTFSGWNQKMLDLSVNGNWVQAILGFLVGLFLAAYSIIFGIETAKGFRWILKRLNTSTNKEEPIIYRKWRLNSFRRHLAAMVVLLLVLGVLLSVSGSLLKKEFGSGSSGAQLWLACLVASFGVWIRWFLARFNGHGLGKSGILRWFPFGTFSANVSAAAIMAGLSTLEKSVNNTNFGTVAMGIQLGFLGCLSTVSTFIAEFNAMRESKHPWRAYVYALTTMGVSFIFGILIYNIPVWAKGFT